MQKDFDEQAGHLQRVVKERDNAREEVSDAHRGAMILFNESKRYESNIKRFQSRAKRDEVIHLRSKNNDLRYERSQLKQQQEVDHVESQKALANSTIANLRSLLDRRAVSDHHSGADFNYISTR